MPDISTFQGFYLLFRDKIPIFMIEPLIVVVPDKECSIQLLYIVFYDGRIKSHILKGAFPCFGIYIFAE